MAEHPCFLTTTTAGQNGKVAFALKLSFNYKKKQIRSSNMSGADRRTRPKSTDEQLSLTAVSSVETSVPIEPANGPDEEEDEFETTDGIDTRSTGSASATSSIYAHTYENGRRYQCFKNGRYPIPNDDSEQDREDMKHAMMLELTDGELFYAPIGDHPQSILDIGTGTGELGLG